MFKSPFWMIEIASLVSWRPRKTSKRSGGMPSSTSPTLRDAAVAPVAPLGVEVPGVHMGVSELVGDPQQLVGFLHGKSQRKMNDVGVPPPRWSG